MALWSTIAAGRSADSLLTITVSGANDITLTTDQSVARELIFSGALTGDVVVFLPVTATETGARWSCLNSCTGAHTLTVKPSGSGNGIALAANKQIVLSYNGTNMVVSGSTDTAAMGAAESGANTSITSLAGITGGLTMTGGLNADILKGNNVALAWGYLTKTLPDTDYTLSAAEMANQVLDLSGSLGAQRKVILPLTAGTVYVVYNHGTTQNLNFIGATGTGTVVANNKRATIVCSGTNWDRVTADT